MCGSGWGRKVAVRAIQFYKHPGFTKKIEDYIQGIKAQKEEIKKATSMDVALFLNI